MVAESSSDYSSELSKENAIHDICNYGLIRKQAECILNLLEENNSKIDDKLFWARSKAEFPLLPEGMLEMMLPNIRNTIV